MSKKLTPWFPGNVKPVRKGYYERDWEGDGNAVEALNDYWDGRAWLHEPNGFNWCLSGVNIAWRGLAKKP